MSCNCDQHIDCGDIPEIAIESISDTVSYSHTVTHSISVDNLQSVTVLETTTRSFSVDHGWDRDKSIDHFVLCQDGTPITCENTTTAIPSAQCTEHCIREINIPYYLDRQQNILVYKRIREQLDFDVSSGGKTANFRLKSGTGQYHKIIIKDTVKTQGLEQFIFVKDGISKVLASQVYEYNPFPATEGGGATWGLYGDVVQRNQNPAFGDPAEANVACILLFPNPPKQAIPQDNDVIAYGFYDYNAIDGGFVETSLAKDDGGKDYFYPYWLRQMPVSSVWRETADTRYGAIINGTLNLEGSQPWIPPNPQTYTLPFGSFAVDTKANFMYSLLVQMSDRAGGSGVVINYTSFGDLLEAIYTKNKLPTREFRDLFPVSPL